MLYLMFNILDYPIDKREHKENFLAVTSVNSTSTYYMTHVDSMALL